MRPLLFALICGLLALPASPAAAHQASDSHLDVRADPPGSGILRVRWDLALRDLEATLALDADRNGVIDWGEVKRREDEIGSLAWSSMAIATTSPCVPAPGPAPALAIARRGELAYAVLQRTLQCPPGNVTLEYRLFAAADAGHRGILVWRPRLDEAVTSVLDPGAPAVTLASTGTHRPGSPHPLRGYVMEGIRHIWLGADHLLFLVALLMGAVMVRDGAAWRAVPAFRPALADTVRIVTAFTVAHSLTLALAVLGIISAPARWIEPAIALSVAVAAVDNLRPILPVRRWVAAFAFGLLHGFGFAGALAELALPQASLGWTLAAFNAGVEAGQLAVVAVFLPVAYAARHGLAYRRLCLQGASAVIGLLALAWFLERLLDLPLRPAVPT